MAQNCLRLLYTYVHPTVAQNIHIFCFIGLKSINNQNELISACISTGGFLRGGQGMWLESYHFRFRFPSRNFPVTAMLRELPRGCALGSPGSARPAFLLSLLSLPRVAPLLPADPTFLSAPHLCWQCPGRKDLSDHMTE